MDRLKNLKPFALVELVLTLASLALVGIVIGRELAPLIGVTGRWAPFITWPIAVVADALWIGSLRMAAQAARQRNTQAVLGLGGLSVAFVAASSLVLWQLGHMTVFSLMPAATMLFTALNLYAENTLADPETRAAIAEASARVRNERALAASTARDMAASAATAVVLDTARHVAALHRDVTLVGVLTRADIEITKVRAEATARLEKSRKAHGDAAARYAELMSQATRPSLEAPQEPVHGLDWAVPGTPQDELDEAFDEALELVAPPAVPHITESLAEFKGEQAVTPAMATLEDVCQVHGVDVPEANEPMDDAQVRAVLSWLRYNQDPPASLRAAQRAFRAREYKCTDTRLRTVWAAMNEGVLDVN